MNEKIIAQAKKNVNAYTRQNKKLQITKVHFAKDSLSKQERIRGVVYGVPKFLLHFLQEYATLIYVKF